MTSTQFFIYFYILFIQVFIFINVIHSVTLVRKTAKVFLAIVASVIVMVSLRFFTSALDGNGSFRILTYIVYQSSTILNILPLLLSLYFFDLHIIRDTKTATIRQGSYIVVWLTLAVYSLLNVFFEHIFLIDDYGHIVKQSGVYVHVYFQVGILLAYGIFTFKYFKRSVSKVHSLFIPLALLPVVGGSFQVIFTDIPALWAMYALLTLFIFIFSIRDDMRRDSLTDVFSRGQFDEHLRKKLNRKRSFSIAMIDLDDFKTINDTYGHNEGDELLVVFTKIIKDTIRCMDMLARVGGDEFVIIFETQLIENGFSALKRVEDSITEFNSRHEKPYEIKYSVGFHFVHEPIGLTIYDVLNTVDQLMYEEKTIHHSSDNIPDAL